MERVFTKDIPADGLKGSKLFAKKDGGKLFAKKGDQKDWPHLTWIGIARSLFPGKNPKKMLDEFSIPVSELGKKLVGA